MDELTYYAIAAALLVTFIIGMSVGHVLTEAFNIDDGY